MKELRSLALSALSVLVFKPNSVWVWSQRQTSQTSGNGSKVSLTTLAGHKAAGPPLKKSHHTVP